MSIVAMNWAWAQPLPPSSKLILMSLADAADETGLCWLRIKIVARKCCVSERTVQRVIKEFERDGVLIVQRHFRDNGAQTSNRYQLRMGPPPDVMSPGDRASATKPTDKMSPPPRHPCRRGGDTVVSPHELPAESISEITTTTSCSLTDLAGCTQLVLPRGLSEADKPSVVARLREVPAADAQMLLDELASALEVSGTIKTTAARWFYGLVKKYTQGSFNPVGAHAVAARRVMPKAPVRMKRAKPADPNVAKAHIEKIAATLRIPVGGAK